jgi:hypothetical protein
MYGIELMCMIIGTLGTAIAGASPHIDMFAVIMFWRVFGGEDNHIFGCPVFSCIFLA